MAMNKKAAPKKSPPDTQERASRVKATTAKAKTDAARFKPIRDTRSLKQKLETKVFGGFEGQATVGYKKGQRISTSPARQVPVGLGQTVSKAKETMVKAPKKKKKK